jgi:hypothetical protein
MPKQRMPRKQKLAGFVRAQKLINEGKMDIRDAVHEAGISATTYYKYLKMFGDKVVGENSIELPAPELPKTVFAKTDLERILAENAALVEQIKLRKELAQIGH